MTSAEVLNVEQMARRLYGLAEDEAPTKSQRNHVAELCRAGKLNAQKAGRRWLIRLEWRADGGQGAAR